MAAHNIRKLPRDDPVGRLVQDYFIHQFCKDYVLIGEDETCMPVYFEKFLDTINNFKIHDSDTFVCTYPKAGTTWAQEMVWLIMNDLDYEGAKALLATRFPFLELSTLIDVNRMGQVLGGKCPSHLQNSLEYISQTEDPRFIKTHLPFAFLPDQIKNGSKSPKMIYVVRDPRDVCVSYYHHGNLLQGWQANMEDFCRVFMANKIQYGSFWKHVLGFWERRHLPNLLFITYEDMKRDLSSVVKKVANFLGKTLTEEQVEQLCQHLSFESMKKNEAVNMEAAVTLRREKKMMSEEGEFLRSGTVGKYKEELSSEMIEKLNAWTKENISGTTFAEQYNYSL